MNTSSRIPRLLSATFEGAVQWFEEMRQREILFHPDDDPADIISVADGSRLFNEPEIREIRAILAQLFSVLGDDVYESAYPVAMRWLSGYQRAA